MKQATEAKTFWNEIYDTTQYSRELDEDVVRALRNAHDFFQPKPGQTLLDVGCGAGATSLFWASTGLEVTAVDFSASAIENLRKRCNKLAITNVRAVVGDAMKIDELGQFDYIFGSFIMHHLEPFTEFAAALQRTLHSPGKAFFYENSAASRLLVWFRTNLVGRFWLPKYGDQDEFPLTPQEIDILRQRFNIQIVFPEMFFFQLASVYLLRRRFSRIMCAIDKFLYTRRIGVRYSYRQYVLMMPKTSSS